jgi:hypothetical protein
MLQILELIDSQLTQLRPFGQILGRQCAGRIGEQNLAAMPSGGNSGSAVHVETNVSIADPLGSTGVQPHPYAQRGALRPGMSRQRTGRLGSRRYRRWGRGERHEEPISGGIDLHTTLLGKRLPQEGLMLRKDCGIGVTQVLEQTGTTFNVGE